jgi:hypothetical protein
MLPKLQGPILRTYFSSESDFPALLARKIPRKINIRRNFFVEISIPEEIKNEQEVGVSQALSLGRKLLISFVPG